MIPRVRRFVPCRDQTELEVRGALVSHPPATTDHRATPYGPVTKRLIEAYAELVDCDFVQQYLDRLA